MARKKQEKSEEKIEKFEKIGNKKGNVVSDSFYYLLGVIISFVLIFATEEFLSTINYLFVIIFAVVAVIQIVNFIVDKDYKNRNYSSMVIAVMCMWMAMFIYKYGDFLFLEMLPVLVSLLLFIMATSSLTKYFDHKINGNLFVSIVSILLGIMLIFVPKSVVYILFKITGVYVLIMIILDFIDYKKKGNL